MPSAPAPIPARSPSLVCRLAALAALLASGVAGAVPLETGDILVTDSTGSDPANSRVFRIDPATGAPTALATGGFLLNPIGVAVRDDGFAFVTNIGSQLVVRVDAAAVSPAPVQVAISALANARGIATAPSGDLYISSPSTDEIIQIDSVTGIGKATTASGLIRFPTGLVREASGDLVVADSGSLGSRVLRVDATDGAQTQLAGDSPLTTDAPPFQVLRDIEIDPTAAGSFLVVDSGARKVFRVDATIPYDAANPNANVSLWAECPGFLSPRGIAVEPGGSVLVSDFTAKKVFRIQPTPLPRPCTELATGSALLGPWDVTVVGTLSPFVPGALLVAGGTENQVYRVDPVTGSSGPVWPLLGFANPVTVTRDLNGDLLVLEFDRIHRVDSGGVKTTVATFAEPVELTGLVVQADGVFLVTDAANDRLVRVIPGTGEKIVVLDEEGAPAGPLVDPRALALDVDGQALIANGGDPSSTPVIPTGVVRVNPFSGETTGTVSDPQLGKLIGVATDINGDYLLADEANDTVWRFRESTPLNLVLYSVSVGNDIVSLRGIALDENRSILVSNQGAKEILRLDPASGTQSEIAPLASFADIQGISLDQVPPPPLLDTDEDGIQESLDNCRSLANADQIDTNQDGYGNRCDADYDDDGAVDNADFTLFKDAYFTASGDPGYDVDIDADSDGVIGPRDFKIFKDFLLLAPGPSGLACAGSIPCPAP